MVVLFTLSVVLPGGCDNREMILMIKRPTEGHSIDQTSASTSSSSSVSQSANVQPGKVMTTLKAGETARAVGVYHGKDLDAFQVKLADVFQDTSALTFEDPDHSDEEPREITVGLSQSGRVLFLSHCDRGKWIRIISARKATLKETRIQVVSA